MRAACAAACRAVRRLRLVRSRRRRYNLCRCRREGSTFGSSPPPGSPLRGSLLCGSPLPGTECFAVTSGDAKVTRRNSPRATLRSAAACNLRSGATAGTSASCACGLRMGLSYTGLGFRVDRTGRPVGGAGCCSAATGCTRACGADPTPTDLNCKTERVVTLRLAYHIYAQA